MAMVTPFFLLLVAGIIDFGMLFRSWEVVTNAAREGARVGVLPAYTADENVVERVEQYMQASGLATSCTLETVTGTECPSSACSVCVQTDTLETGAGAYTARVVTVSSEQNLPSLSWVGVFFGNEFGTVDVTSTSSMRTEVAGVPVAP